MKNNYISRGSSWQHASQPSIHLLGGYEAVRENIGNFTSRHMNWTLDYTISDGGFYKVNGLSKKWNRPASLGRLYPPGTQIDYITDSVMTPIKTLYISFKNIMCHELEDFNWKENTHVRFIDKNKYLQNELQDIVNLTGIHGQKSFYLAQGIFYKILNLLFTSENIAKNEYIIQRLENPKLRGFVEVVHDYLANHVDEKITLDQIAKDLNMSKSKLSHRFRVEGGESPLQVHSRLKIEKAKLYILNGESNKLIADSLGYSDEYHFSKNFKTITGVSPSAYKKQYAK